MRTAGAKSSSSVLTETSPYERFLDNSPLDLQASSGVSHSRGWHTSLAMHNTDSFGHSYSLDRPRSPGLWTSEVVFFSFSQIRVCTCMHPNLNHEHKDTCWNRTIAFFYLPLAVF